MGIDGLIFFIWKFMGNEMELDICAGPISMQSTIKSKKSLKDLIKLLVV
jgi:hypothetical protein